MTLVLSTHPTTGCSIGRYIDALIASLRAHPELVGNEHVVADGLPARDLSGTHLIAVGGQDDSVSSGEQTTAVIGRYAGREEEYIVRVACSAQTGSLDQKYVRDQALALMRVVEEVLQRDPEMKDQNDGQPLVRWSEIAGDIELRQTTPSMVEDFVESKRQVGRWAEMSFSIRVKNRTEDAD